MLTNQLVENGKAELLAREDAQFGRSMPTGADDVGDATADLAACRASLSNGSRTFLAASFLLPRSVREAACALYAFCRMADDEVDTRGPDEAPAAVARLHQRLARIYDGRPDAEVTDRAFAAVVKRYAIPKALPAALLEGFEWDTQSRRYERIEDVLDYAARVAGTVGAMMALLMGVRSPSALARACDLGAAMQLSNIARDVGEDARMGRLYLPRQWLREAGIDPDAWLAAPRFDAAVASVVRRLLQAADELYARVGAGIAELPLACRPGINAARFLYAEIGHEVRRRGFDSIGGRAVVSPARKTVGLLRAAVSLAPGRAAAAVPPLPANAFLVESVTSTPAVVTAPPEGSAIEGFESRVVWLFDLFDRLERSEREQRMLQSVPSR